MEPQERLEKIAAQFGDSDIKIFVGRDKVYPDKFVSDAKVNQIEAALKSPESERASIKVTEGKETIYRSIEGAVTDDTKGLAAQLQSQKADYFELLQGFSDKVPGYFDNKFTPEFVNQQLSSQRQGIDTQAFGQSIDRWAMTEAVSRGIPKDEALKVISEQSPYVAKLNQEQAAYPKELENYVAPNDGMLSREFDHAAATYASVGKTEKEVSWGKLPPGTLRAEVKTVAPAPEQSKALVHVPRSVVLIPVGAAQQQLNERMPQAVTEPTKTAEVPSIEQSLATAQSKIEAMQKQLDKTTAAVDNLSSKIEDRSLKGWAVNTAQKLDTTAKTFATTAKSSVGQWVEKGIDRIKATADYFQIAARTAVSNVKFAAAVKSVEVKEAVIDKVGKVFAPVDTQALSKAAGAMINIWGKDGKFEGETFDFKRSESGDINIATKDGNTVFANGKVTENADATVKAHLNQIPHRLEVVKARAQVQAQTETQTQTRTTAISR